MKTKKIVCIMAAVALMIGAGLEIIAAQTRKSTKTTKTVAAKTTAKKTTQTTSKINESEAGAVAEKLINDYVAGNFDLEKSATTKKFKDEFKKRSRALDLVDKRLSGETLTTEEKNFLKNYQGIEYDPMFSAAIYDINPDHSKFKVVSYNKNTGVFLLRDTVDPIYAVGSCDGNYNCEPIYVEISVKVVSQNGKLLVDGAGDVNMK